MKKLFYPAIFAICLSGCSSSATNESSNIRFNVDVSELNNPNVNAQPDSNANTGAATNSLTDMKGNQLVIKKGEGNVNSAPLDPNAKPHVYPASDNSEITSMMNKQGQPVEIRFFKNNPILAKVEKVYVELDKPVITAYLKNGKKIDLTSVKIEDPMKSSAADIIDVINVGKSNPSPTKHP